MPLTSAWLGPNTPIEERTLNVTRRAYPTGRQALNQTLGFDGPTVGTTVGRICTKADWWASEAVKWNLETLKRLLWGSADRSATQFSMHAAHVAEESMSDTLSNDKEYKCFDLGCQ